MWIRIQRLLDRIESRIALWAIIAPGIPIMSAGAFTAWLASGVERIDQFGWFGWWLAGLIGASLALLIAIGFVFLRNNWIKGRLLRQWGQNVESINPVDPEFTRRRIKIEDLANPITKRIHKKRFIDCELMGPANIIFSVPVSLSHVNFKNCDVIVARENSYINNVVVFNDVTVLSCDIWSCTIYITRDMVQQFVSMNPNIVSLTGVPEIDNQSPLSTAEEKRP